MAFIKNYRCHSCGSSLGKWIEVFSERIPYCFLCCATEKGKIPLKPVEVDGLEPEEVKRLVGREPGSNTQIIERLHSEHLDASAKRNTAYLQYSLNLTTFDAMELDHKDLGALRKGELVQFPIGNAVTRRDIEQVVDAMKKLKEQHGGKVSSGAVCGCTKGSNEEGCKGQEPLGEQKTSRPTRFK